MKHKHLTDNEIQLYILEVENCGVYIIEHMKQCDDCKMKAAEYKALFEGIQQQEKSKFDFSLADLVTEQLPLSQPRSIFDRVFLCAIAVVVILFLSVISYLFGNTLLSLGKHLNSAFAGLAVTTVSCVAVFVFIDIRRKYQKKQDILNFS